MCLSASVDLSWPMQARGDVNISHVQNMSRTSLLCCAVAAQCHLLVAAWKHIPVVLSLLQFSLRPGLKMRNWSSCFQLL